MHALVGLNGAGETTLMRLLLGMLHPEAATMRICGHDLRTAQPTIWANVGHFIDHFLAHPELGCRANLGLAETLFQ